MTPKRRRSIRIVGAASLLAVTLASPISITEIAAFPPGCNTNTPTACLYESDLTYPVGTIDNIELIDTARLNDAGVGHAIPIFVRYPENAGEPRPVVIWNHGGGPRYNGKYDSEEWGDLLAAAGYVVIHPSRVVPELPLSQAQIDTCVANNFYTANDGYPTADAKCQDFLGGLRYGAENSAYIIDHLADIEAESPDLTGLLDHETVVVAGHSGGTTTVHINAGAWQQFDTTTLPYTRALTEPVAFFATGPQGPEYAGFGTGFQGKDNDAEGGAGWDEHSWVGITAPYMLVTGVGDETGEDPVSRVSAFLTSEGNGNKLLLWDTEPNAVHETMNIHKCDSPTQADHCMWIGSAGLAYFDAVVRGRNAARKWLKGDALETLTSGAIELFRR